MIEKIRNFCIIAHIDHGKSTLADRFLEITGVIEKEKNIEQFLDQLTVERKHGVTVKMQPVRLNYKGFILNLIDTPGHSDFSYEVKRALSAVEGAILLVDATQGIQAQTIFHFNEAKKQNKIIIPVINKIDLKDPSSNLIEELKNMTGLSPILVSAKLGYGVEEVLEKIIELIPYPKIEKEKLALIFDSHYEKYKGVVFHIRVFGGEFKEGDEVILPNINQKVKIIEVGYFLPQMEKTEKILSGEIGYLISNLKKSNIFLVGESITEGGKSQFKFEKPQSFIYASFFPQEEKDFLKFKEVIEKIWLNDPSLSVEEIYLKNFGRGFKIGFLGLFHLEIIKERIEEEFGTKVIITFPLINYKVILKDGKEILITENLPPENQIKEIQEPWVEGFIIVPKEYSSFVFELIKQKRGEIVQKTDFEDNLEIFFNMPLEELVTNFYDILKSRTSGYASFWWKFKEYRKNEIGELDILINETKTFSFLVVKEKAEKIGRNILLKLKEYLPRENFAIKLQAAYNKKIIARETIPAIAKNPAEWLYGGDRTRKMKLWKKQKEGKKKLQQLSKGKAKVPSEVLIKIFKEL